MGKTEWAKVERMEDEFCVVIGADVIRAYLQERFAFHFVERINAALNAHPEIVRLREVEKAADKMAEALEQLNMECRMADNRGELAGEVDGGTMDNAESALEAYDKSKSQDKEG